MPSCCRSDGPPREDRSCRGLQSGSCTADCIDPPPFMKGGLSYATRHFGVCLCDWGLSIAGERRRAASPFTTRLPLAASPTPPSVTPLAPPAGERQGATSPFTRLFPPEAFHPPPHLLLPPLGEPASHLMPAPPLSPAASSQPPPAPPQLHLLPARSAHSSAGEPRQRTASRPTTHLTPRSSPHHHTPPPPPPTVCLT